MMNMPKVADFLIASEGEIKKVSWSIAVGTGRLDDGGDFVWW